MLSIKTQQYMSVLTDSEFEQFQKLILDRTGIYFGQRRRSELQRHVQSTMKKQQMPEVDRLYKQLVQQSTESPLWELLIEHIIVGETYFFREQLLFEALRNKVLPDIIKHHEKDRSLRIWSAGCSTGEEPYSLAILLDKLLGPAIDQWRIFILATDINKPSLKKGIDGQYRKWSLRQTPNNIISTYFDEKNDIYQICKKIHRRVMFSYLNLKSPVYPSLSTCTQAMDLILWRNVAIYFTTDVIADVLNRFHQCLLPSGYFNIGASEAGHMADTQFVQVPVTGAFIYQKTHSEPQMIKKPTIPLEKPAKQPATSPLHQFQYQKPQKPPVPEKKKQSQLEMAETFTKERNFSKAIAAYQAHLKLSPKDAQAWYQMARVYANMGDLENAKNACMRALDHEPLLVEAYYIKGLIHEEDGELDAAINDYKKILYLNSDFVLAHYHLSTVYQQIQDDKMAERHRIQAIRMLSRLPEDETIPGSDDLTTQQLLAMIG